MSQDNEIPRFDIHVYHDELEGTSFETARMLNGDYCLWDDVEPVLIGLRNEIVQLTQKQQIASANATFYADRLMQILTMMENKNDHT